jgi:hypothetical protein
MGGRGMGSGRKGIEPAEEDDGRGRQLEEGACGVEAGAPGHAEVEQADVDGEAGAQGDRLIAVVGGQDPIAQRLELGPERQAGQGLVLRHEDQRPDVRSRARSWWASSTTRASNPGPELCQKTLRLLARREAADPHPDQGAAREATARGSCPARRSLVTACRRRCPAGGRRPSGRRTGGRSRQRAWGVEVPEGRAGAESRLAPAGSPEWFVFASGGGAGHGLFGAEHVHEAGGVGCRGGLAGGGACGAGLPCRDLGASEPEEPEGARAGRGSRRRGAGDSRRSVRLVGGQEPLTESEEGLGRVGRERVAEDDGEVVGLGGGGSGARRARSMRARPARCRPRVPIPGPPTTVRARSGRRRSGRRRPGCRLVESGGLGARRGLRALPQGGHDEDRQGGERRGGRASCGRLLRAACAAAALP